MSDARPSSPRNPRASSQAMTSASVAGLAGVLLGLFVWRFWSGRYSVWASAWTPPEPGLAQLLGASRQRVNQELKHFEREGAVRVEPTRLSVLSRDKLLEAAER